jgi:hypothetical protein
MNDRPITILGAVPKKGENRTSHGRAEDNWGGKAASDTRTD